MKRLVSRFLSLFRAVKLFTPASILLLLLGGALLFGWAVRSRADLSLNISRSGTNVQVTWTNGGAVLQTATNVTGAWNDLSNAASPYPLLTTNAEQFLRLRQAVASPNPALITDLEPAYLSTSGGTFYLVGTNFGTNSVVYLGGSPAGSVTFINSNLLQVTAGAFGAGTYNVSVVNGGQTNATLADGLTIETTPNASLESPPGVSGAASGELKESSVDIDIPSGIGPDFTLARTYRSRIGPTNSPAGNGWEFSCDISIATNGANVIVYGGTGRADTFYHQGDGTYTRAGFFRSGAFAGSVFTMTFADKSKWVFNALNAGTAPGKISQHVDRNGNTMTYTYDPSGQLTNVTDALGRPIQFSYDGSGHLTNVTDYIGRTTTYTYDGNNNLASVTTPAVTGTPTGNDFPSGKTTTYTYTYGNADDNLNHNLTSIIDPTGVVIETNTYSTGTNVGALDYDHLLSTADGPNLPTMFSYEAQTPAPANNYATVKVYVNDPVGNVTMALYDSRNRPLQVNDLTGRSTPGVAVTSSSNLPTGKLRASDPAAFTTTYAYDLDSLATKVTWPRGNVVTMTYAGDAGTALSVRERGNRLSMTQTPAPGAPADQSSRTTTYQYQPGFGTPEGGSAVAPTQHVDACGNTTTATYDANGNCLSITPPALATGHNFTFNSYGQMTSHTSPADANSVRQVDNFNYYSSGPQKGYLQSEVADANGFALTSTYGYDAVGNVTNSVDPRGNNSVFVYNQLDQLMRELSPPGAAGLRSQTDYTYDAAASIGVVDFYHNIPVPHLDLTVRVSISGRVVAETVQNFDQNGNPGANATITDTYAYDALGRLVSETNQVSGAAVTVTRYAYDGNEQLTNEMAPLAVSGADAFNTVQYKYDERGMLYQETAAPGSAGQSTDQYDYDANGNVSRVSEGLESAPRVTTMVASGFGSASGADFSSIDVFVDVATPDASGARGHGRSKSFILRNSKDVAPEDPGARGHGRSKSYIIKNSRDVAPDDPGARGHGKSKSFVYKNSKDEAPDDPGARGHGRSKSYIYRNSRDVAPDDPGARGHGRSKSYILRNSKDEAPEDPGAGGGTFTSFFDVFADVATGGDSIPTVNGQYYRQLDDSGDSDAPGVANSPGQSCFGTPTVKQWGLQVGTLAGSQVKTKNPSMSVPGVVTDPLGNSVTNHYDACDNLVSTSVTGTNGAGGTVALGTATFSYDALDRLTSRTVTILNAAGSATGTATTTASYADNSQVTAVTDPLGHVTSFTYDTADRLHSVTDPKGNSVTDGYDANGNVITETNRLKSDLGNADYLSTKSFGYDALNRCTNSTDSVGNTIVYQYDSRDNVVETIDPRGVVMQFTYDDLDRQTATGVDQNGDSNAFGAGDITITYAYDADSRLVTQTDPNGNTTTTVYDSLNRQTSQVAADGTTISVTYDVHGNVTSGTDADGTVIAYIYDGCDRRVSGTITPGGGVASTTTFEQYSYDGLGRNVRAVNDSSTNSYTYDSLNRKLTDNQSGLTVTYTYDAVGNCVTMATPGGRTLGYTYDAGNLCRSVALLTTSDGDTTGVLATNNFLGGLRERSDNRNGTYTLWSYDGGTGTTNASGDYGWCQISRLQHLNTNGTVIDDISYAFDRSQNKTGKTTIYGSLTNAVTYIYDNAERLTNTVVTTNSVLARSTVYTLDKAGNRQLVSGDNHPGSYTLSGADAEKNQYSSSPLGTYAYDGNGSRVAEFTNAALARTYSYDYDDHPAGITQYSGGGTASLTVSNFSFESDTITAGAFVYLVPQNWSKYDPSSILNMATFTNVVGVIRPTNTEPFFPGRVTQGSNAALVYLAGSQSNVPAGLQQTLASTLQPSTTYTLNVDVGNIASGLSQFGSSGGSNIAYNFTGFPGYQIQLLAGATVIASDNNTLNGSIPEGQFRTSFSSCNSSSFPGLLGQALTIRLINLNIRPGLEVDFDNVRLTATTSPVGTPLASFVYDTEGRQVQESVVTGGVTNVTTYVYDGEDVIEERNGANTVTASYTAWPDMEDPQGDTIVGESRINGANYWGHADDQASMRAVTLDNGTVAERYDYADYGEPAFYNGSGSTMTNSAVGMTWLYTGFKYDPASGFYTADRDLDPRTGCWLQIDPEGIWYDEGTRGNGHNYVGNNPATYTDAPDGGGASGRKGKGKAGKRSHGRSKSYILKNSRDVAPEDPGARGHSLKRKK